MADLDNTISKLKQLVDRIENPKDLQRHWELVTVIDGVHEFYSPPEGWNAGRLTAELMQLLEANDDTTDIHFEIYPHNSKQIDA